MKRLVLRTALTAALGFSATAAMAQTAQPVPGQAVVTQPYSAQSYIGQPVGAPGATRATVAATTNMQAAPDPTVHLAPPKGPCGIFETCASTKIGLGKGDFLVRLSALGAITNNTSTSVNIQGGVNPTALKGPYIPGAYIPGTKGTGGRLTATNQVMPELTFEYFFTDHIALDLIAASERFEAKAHNTRAKYSGLDPSGNLDVGSFWALPPTLTVSYHFLPHERFNPYAGVGLMVAFFHNTHPGKNLGVNQLFNRLKLQTTPAVAFEFGFDYQLVGNWFLNVDVKQALLHTNIYLNRHINKLTNGPVHARDSINPTLVGMGIEYRF
ncbi:OmpW/AlkL family protein [Oecophyllibacter saccharovorans]|uniref:OmpW/AlkL family protein n=1 Tax=Oecophyllibacter saccharovorans TaxID=2558360 RepID=UPI0011418A3C|nr:OmpW family outer membrane protein [Oecophyllibacter saccharovorans]QDH15115.1 OmpW family protein [Oecophyllibacter saccharovorans]TPW35292.1 OmpW family protein [Oecophyllibacter saccharovorans]